MNARRLSAPAPITSVCALAASVLLLLFAAGHLSGQTAGLALQVLSRDARRSIPITTSGSQELVALDDLASLFQLNVRDDGGAITVGYKGKTIVLTADQTIASVAGRLISLAAAPTRVGNRWLVPIDFIGRALAPVYDARLDLRRGSHLLVVGDLRVPRVAVRHESSATSARLTFDISPTATPTLTQPSAQRLVVRIDADALDLTLPTFQSVGFIQDLRGLDGTSVAIDLGPRFTAFRPVIQSIDNGTRLTIDFSGAVADTAAAPPPATPADTQPTFVSSAPGVRTVAIDAGHGGDDAGARGTAGALEKNIALAVARRLRSALEARLGVRVIMTRDDDVAVPIENRSALANNNKADLLISLHLNASFRPEVAGATTYVAAFSDADLATEGLAPERLPVFGGGLRAIDVVPWNLAQIPHRERSEQLASLVAAALNGRVPVAPRPVEHAPLRVLESANMPAVLVEMGYLTNPAQETALAGPDTQAVIAQSLLDAVVQFRDSIAPLPDGVLR